MVRLGAFLCLLGFGSAVLHFTDVQFRLLIWAEPAQPFLGLALGGVGALILVLIASRKKNDEADGGPQEVPAPVSGRVLPSRVASARPRVVGLVDRGLGCSLASARRLAGWGLLADRQRVTTARMTFVRRPVLAVLVRRLVGLVLPVVRPWVVTVRMMVVHRPVLVGLVCRVAGLVLLLVATVLVMVRVMVVHRLVGLVGLVCRVAGLVLLLVATVLVMVRVMVVHRLVVAVVTGRRPVLQVGSRRLRLVGRVVHRHGRRVVLARR